VAYKNRLRLHGFNNISKTLSFNLYEIKYAESEADREYYFAYLEQHYAAQRLVALLRQLAGLIGANVLHVSHQDYDPAGASVSMLVSECNDVTVLPCAESLGRSAPDTVVVHLDKSHISTHTYPENHPGNGICTFRTDIDLMTCGKISPLKTMDHLITCLSPDVVFIDYRVRGFTRDLEGNKHFVDHAVSSIQDFLDCDLRANYRCIDANMREENIFHTKMIKREFDVETYLIRQRLSDYSPSELQLIGQRLKQERREIFYARGS